MAVVFLGPPGAGKGTQAKTLARALGLAHVASGDVFREAIQSRTSLGRRVERLVSQGKLVPDRIATQVVLDHLSRSGNKKGFILDGFPRTRAQAIFLERHLAKEKQSLRAVIWFYVHNPVIIRRLSARTQCPVCSEVYNVITHPPRKAGRCDRGGGTLARRRDDEPQVVRKRLQVYYRTARPLLNYYKKRGILFKVNGEDQISHLSRSLLVLFRNLRKGHGRN